MYLKRHTQQFGRRITGLCLSGLFFLCFIGYQPAEANSLLDDFVQEAVGQQHDGLVPQMDMLKNRFESFGCSLVFAIKYQQQLWPRQQNKEIRAMSYTLDCQVAGGGQHAAAGDNNNKDSDTTGTTASPSSVPGGYYIDAGGVDLEGLLEESLLADQISHLSQPFVGIGGDLDGLWRIQIDPETPQVLLANILHDASDGAGIEINAVPQFSNDTKVYAAGESKQRYLEAINYYAITACEDTLEPVSVAIIDNGFDVNHEDLTDRIATTYNPINDGDDVMVPDLQDPLWNHGTVVAGIIGAEDQNVLGIHGVAPNAELMLIKASDDSTPGDSIDFGLEAIAAAYLMDADIINVSWGVSQDYTVLKKLIRKVTKKSVVIASAGNQNVSTPYYPASYEGVVSVGALDKNNEKAWFSNYGNDVDLYAPGISIYSTDLDNSYNYFDGTSEAGPLVVGAMALVLGKGGEEEDLFDYTESLRLGATTTKRLTMKNICTEVAKETPYAWWHRRFTYYQG